MLEEGRSFTSLENLVETQTNVSRLSNGRRSRKDRSKGNKSCISRGGLSTVNARNINTPHEVSQIIA